MNRSEARAESGLTPSEHLDGQVQLGPEFGLMFGTDPDEVLGTDVEPRPSMSTGAIGYRRPCDGMNAKGRAPRRGTGR